ncbi:MAG: ATP-binding protein [Pirellulaceae bacterium]
MSRSGHFQTRARSIDHLGRGQIADCPTAVTELFKNAHDAYARNVHLHLFDGNPRFGAIFDDGCGMSLEDVTSKWLVVGTESKIESDVPKTDRFGLEERTKLGEKGIGRLSAGFLAPVTLLVTRKKESKFVAVLVDWRLFENPYLMVSDIEVPIEEFSSIDELSHVFTRLMQECVENLDGSAVSSPKEKQRIQDAWATWTRNQKKTQGDSNHLTLIRKLPSAKIDFESACEHWTGCRTPEFHGTGLFLIQLNHELSAWFEDSSDEEIENARSDLTQTLNGFIDADAAARKDFHYDFCVHDHSRVSTFVSSEQVISSDYLQTLEHYIIGDVDESGWLRATVKAFGKERGKYSLKLQLPSLLDKQNISRIGPFKIELAAAEMESKKTTHSDAELSHVKQQLDSFGGMFVYRDGVRVLPYGKEDSDFFQIDARRGLHAGREYWAHRKFFGRVYLSRKANPSLKDKAGREGLVENQAKRLLRSAVIMILKDLSRKFLGTDSPIRASEIAKAESRKQRGREAASVARVSRKKEFLGALRSSERHLAKTEARLVELHVEVKAAAAEEKIDALETLQAEIQSLLATASKMELPAVPKGLEDRTDEYRINRDRIEEVVSALETLQSNVISNIAGSKSKQPSRIVDSFRKQVLTESKEAHTEAREEISSAVKTLQAMWVDRIHNSESRLVSATERIVAKVNEQSDVPDAIDDIRVLWNELQNTILTDAAGVMQSLRLLNNGVDLSAALEVVDESDMQSRDRIEQLNLLAQSGIAVEIISHDLEEMAQQTEFSLKKLPPGCRDNTAFKRGFAAFQSLVDRFRFLSPLSVATYRARRTIKGGEIIAYVKEFFQRRFDSAGIDFEANKEFELMEITDVPSRIFPVFVNLVNNSLYWLKFVQSKKIRLVRKGALVLVADSGPGVDKEDQEHLFEMFFTKRPQGRGIGLYLCRANLAVARHQIRLAGPDDPKILSGANFVIEFRGLND